MEFQQQSFSIDQLIQNIRTSRLALPDFQRDFVWSQGRVVELLESVARQWPIGSLLLLRGPQSFAIKSIDSGPVINDRDLELYVLDGQQRLTSLYHAVADVSNDCYFVDFDALGSNEEEYLGWQSRDQFQKKYPDLRTRAQKKIALIADIWDTQNFYKWLEQLPDHNSKTRCVELREHRLAGLQSKVYKVFATVLDQSIALEALSRIFETLNRTGVRLTAFDLMVATLYPKGFKLRDEWDSAVDSYDAIARLKPEELEVLKLISLLIRGTNGKKAARGVRQGDLLTLDPGLIKARWSEAVYLYNSALEYCSRNFGVTSENLIPAWSMILGVAAWLKFHPGDTVSLTRWWYYRIIDQYFSQASNTRIVSDFDAIISHQDSQDHWPLKQIEIDLNVPAKTNGILTRGVGSVLVQIGAKDVLTGNKIRDYESVAFRSIQPDGRMTRPKGTDSLSSIIVVSKETDLKLGKATEVSKLSTTAIEIMREQGIQESSFARDSAFIQHVIDRQLVGL
jgi:hypothetical protein